MFDSFIPKNSLCPNCGEKLRDFQSKNFDQSLETYYEGKTTFRKYGSTSTFLNNGIYKGLGDCLKCHKFFTAKIEIKHKIFKRIFDLKEHN